MFDLDSWQEIAATLAKNKLRALLTACGVFWGLFMLIVMLGIGKGLESSTERNLGSLTVRSVFIWGQRTSLPYRGRQPGRYVHFRDEDIAILRRVPGVEYVAPRLQLGGWREGDLVTRGAKSGNFPVLGDVPEYRFVEPFDLLRGRFLNTRDMQEKRKVAVIGDMARSVLFGEEDPIGQTVKIKGFYFEIVGEVLSEKTGDDGDRVRSSLFVPFSTFQHAFNQRDKVGWFGLTARANVSAERVENLARAALAERQAIHPADPQAIGSFNLAEKAEQIQGLFRGIRVFVWFVGSLTLFAGVLGVSNILLITVKERTKEIGVRKALGATPWTIVSMILKEAVALTALSGYVGLVAGVGVLELFRASLARLPQAPMGPPEVNLSVALVATLILVLSGAIAGIVPARHAARISPVEALRAE